MVRPAMMAEAYRETSHSPVECTTLLRWSPLTGTEGSNPSVSALKAAVACRSTPSLGGLDRWGSSPEVVMM
jgi:hypothetical protein